MKIKGIEGISDEELIKELERGGRFILYEYCVSLLIVTFRRPSSIYFFRDGESSVTRSFGFTLVSLLFGWWGLPWGPIYTLGTVASNLSGGKDVTAEVLASFQEAGAEA